MTPQVRLATRSRPRPAGKRRNVHVYYRDEAERARAGLLPERENA